MKYDSDILGGATVKMDFLMYAQMRSLSMFTGIDTAHDARCSYFRLLLSSRLAMTVPAVILGITTAVWRCGSVERRAPHSIPGVIIFIGNKLQPTC